MTKEKTLRDKMYFCTVSKCGGKACAFEEDLKHHIKLAQQELNKRFKEKDIPVECGWQEFLCNCVNDIFLKHIKSQMPLKEKVKKADFIIDNNGTKKRIIAQYLPLLKIIN